MIYANRIQTPCGILRWRFEDGNIIWLFYPDNIIKLSPEQQENLDSVYHDVGGTRSFHWDGAWRGVTPLEALQCIEPDFEERWT